MGQVVNTFSTGPVLEFLPGPAALPARVRDAAFSPDGRLLAVAHDQPPSLSVYEFDSENERVGRKLDLPGGTLEGNGLSVSFSPDGRFLALGHGAEPFLHVYEADSENGIVKRRLGDPATPIPGAANCVAFTPDGRYLAVGHSRSPTFSLYEFDSENGHIGRRLDNPEGWNTGVVTGAIFTRDGRHLVLTHWGDSRVSVYAFDPENGEIGGRVGIPPESLSGSGQKVALSSDERYIAAIVGTPFLYEFDSKTGAIGRKLDLPEEMSAAVLDFAFSPNARYLAAVRATEPFLVVCEFDPETGTFGSRLADPAVPLEGNGQSVSFSADGRFLAAGHMESPFLSLYSDLYFPEGNLHFRDPENGRYFSDADGKRFKPLRFGEVRAGRFSDVKAIDLENNLDVGVYDVEVWVEDQPLPDEVEISFTEDPFVSEQLPLVVPGSHGPNEGIARLYVRIRTSGNRPQGEDLEDPKVVVFRARAEVDE